jgi:hypothetical protein
MLICGVWAGVDLLGHMVLHKMVGFQVEVVQPDRGIG